MHERRKRKTICVSRRINLFSLNVQLFRDFRLQYFVNLINLTVSTTVLHITASQLDTCSFAKKAPSLCQYYVHNLESLKVFGKQTARTSSGGKIYDCRAQQDSILASQKRIQKRQKNFNSNFETNSSTEMSTFSALLLSHCSVNQGNLEFPRQMLTTDSFRSFTVDRLVELNN
jgi:hypothetical protein